MKPQTQGTVMAVIVLTCCYLCGGSCIGCGLKEHHEVDTSQLVVGAALIIVPTVAVGILLISHLLGFGPGPADQADRESQRHERCLRSMQRGLSPPQGGDRPAVPATWTPVANLGAVLPHLGEQERKFTYTQWHAEAIFTAGVIFLGGVVMLVIGVVTLAAQRGSGPMNAMMSATGLLLMGGTALALVLAIWWKTDYLCVLICEKGLVRLDRGRFIVFLWADILELYQFITDVEHLIKTTREYGFGLQRCDGEVLRIYEGVNQRDVGPLADLLQAKVAAHLWPRMIMRLTAGEEVIFGPLTMNRIGVSNRRETIPWSELEAITIAEGVLQITKTHGWLSWPRIEAREIPNLYVFLALADNTLKTRHEQGRVEVYRP
jgi:hypothetical protein